MSAEYEILVAPDGREYYYNKKTKESVFAKPDALKGTDEQFDVDPWIECRSSRGKTFFHNTVTKESIWSRPRWMGVENDSIPLCGIGMNMRILHSETAKYLLCRLMEQHGVVSLRDGLCKLATEPVFRAVDEETRRRVMKEHLHEQQERLRVLDLQQQSFYRDEVCRMETRAADFFEFNEVFCKHPYYSRIADKFGCYEHYVEKHSGGTDSARLERIFRNLRLGLDASVTDVLEMGEVSGFDRKAVLQCFSTFFRRQEKEHFAEIELGRRRAETEHRKSFLLLLHSLHEQGLICRRMKFKDAFELFRNNEAFLGLLGTSESPKETYFGFVSSLEGQEPVGADRGGMQRHLECGEKEEGEI